MKKHEEKTLSKKLEATLLELALIRGKIKKTDSDWNVDCSTCTNYGHRTLFDWWHCVPQVHGKACKFLLNNINAQCKKCNWLYGQWEQAKHLIYIEKEYGKKYMNYLLELDGTIFKPTITRLEDAIDEVQNHIIKRYISNNKQERIKLIEYMQKPSRKAKLKDILEILNWHNE